MLPMILNITLDYLNSFFSFYLVCNFTKEEYNADILVSEQVGVAAMAVVGLRWSSRSAIDQEWLVARTQAARYDHSSLAGDCQMSCSVTQRVN